MFFITFSLMAVDALEFNYKQFLNEYEKYEWEKTRFTIPVWICDDTGKMIYTDSEQYHWRIYKYLYGESFDLITVSNKIKLFAYIVSKPVLPAAMAARFISRTMEICVFIPESLGNLKHTKIFIVNGLPASG